VQNVAPQVAQGGATDPLPSRRALRDPATEASEAAEAALQAQQVAQAAAAQQAQLAQQQQAEALQAQQAQQAAAQQAAEQAAAQQAQFAAQQAQLAAQQAQFAAQQQAQQQAAPALPPEQQVASQSSPPVPTLPVQPKSFLEQAGYAPLDAVPADQAGWNPAAAQATQQQPAEQQPAPQQQAQQQPIAPQQYAAQPPSAPVQPLQASAWDQAAQQANEYSGLASAQNQWNQPVAQPDAPAATAPTGWDAPPQAVPQPTDGIDSLFAGAPATAAPYTAADPGAAGWGLTPGEQAPDHAGRRGGAREAESQTAGSSTFWGWLIAISPILAAGSIGYVLASTGYVLSGWPIEAAVAAPYLLVLLFALADRSALVNLGHNSPRSPGWALLSAPVYLIVRASETRREDGSGTALTLAWFFSVLVGIGGFVGYGFLTGHALIAGLPS
jgi:hypothetical protein